MRRGGEQRLHRRLRAGREVHGQPPPDPVQAHPLHDAGQAEAVVAVGVGEAHPGHGARRDVGERHLPLGALARVEQEALAVPAQQVAVVVAGPGRHLRRGAQDHELAHHATSLPRAAPPSVPQPPTVDRVNRAAAARGRGMKAPPSPASSLCWRSSCRLSWSPPPRRPRRPAASAGDPSRTSTVVDTSRPAGDLVAAPPRAPRLLRPPRARRGRRPDPGWSVRYVDEVRPDGSGVRRAPRRAGPGSRSSCTPRPTTRRAWPPTTRPPVSAWSTSPVPDLPRGHVGGLLRGAVHRGAGRAGPAAVPGLRPGGPRHRLARRRRRRPPLVTPGPPALRPAGRAGRRGAARSPRPPPTPPGPPARGRRPGTAGRRACRSRSRPPPWCRRGARRRRDVDAAPPGPPRPPGHQQRPDLRPGPGQLLGLGLVDHDRVGEGQRRGRQVGVRREVEHDPRPARRGPGHRLDDHVDGQLQLCEQHVAGPEPVEPAEVASPHQGVGARGDDDRVLARRVDADDRRAGGGAGVTATCAVPTPQARQPVEVRGRRASSPTRPTSSQAARPGRRPRPGWRPCRPGARRARRRARSPRGRVPLDVEDEVLVERAEDDDRAHAPPPVPGDVVVAGDTLAGPDRQTSAVGRGQATTAGPAPSPVRGPRSCRALGGQRFDCFGAGTVRICTDPSRAAPLTVVPVSSSSVSPLRTPVRGTRAVQSRSSTPSPFDVRDRLAAGHGVLRRRSGRTGASPPRRPRPARSRPGTGSSRRWCRGSWG